MPNKPKELTISEAATYIGCSVRNVHSLIKLGNKALGRLHARKEPAQNGRGFVYRVPVKEAKLFRDAEVGPGWPRGKSRHTKGKRDA